MRRLRMLGLLSEVSFLPMVTACMPCSGAAQSDEEAGRVCEALAHAGIVLRFGDCIFLRPQDVVEIMMRVGHLISLQAFSHFTAMLSCTPEGTGYFCDSAHIRRLWPLLRHL